MRTVNCIEAIKANREGKRIRTIGSDAWVVPNFFDKAVAISMKECLSDWEIEDEPLVLWVNIYADASTGCAYNTKEAADENASYERIKCIKMVECRDE